LIASVFDVETLAFGIALAALKVERVAGVGVEKIAADEPVNNFVCEA